MTRKNTESYGRAVVISSELTRAVTALRDAERAIRLAHSHALNDYEHQAEPFQPIEGGVSLVLRAVTVLDETWKSYASARKELS